VLLENVTGEQAGQILLTTGQILLTKGEHLAKARSYRCRYTGAVPCILGGQMLDRDDSAEGVERNDDLVVGTDRGGDNTAQFGPIQAPVR
jgi:hypothetical protein